jgi:hypothetical protein
MGGAEPCLREGGAASAVGNRRPCVDRPAALDTNTLTGGAKSCNKPSILCRCMHFGCFGDVASPPNCAPMPLQRPAPPARAATPAPPPARPARLAPPAAAPCCPTSRASPAPPAASPLRARRLARRATAARWPTATNQPASTVSQRAWGLGGVVAWGTPQAGSRHCGHRTTGSPALHCAGAPAQLPPAHSAATPADATLAHTTPQCLRRAPAATCPAGQGGNGASPPACATCAAGTVGSGSLLSNQPCVACTGENIAATTGLSSCTACGTGQVANGAHTSCSYGDWRGGWGFSWCRGSVLWRATWRKGRLESLQKGSPPQAFNPLPPFRRAATCPAGQGGNEGTPACASCPAGKYGDGTLLANQPCVACAAGSAAAAGSSSCTVCSSTGAVANGDQSACVCAAGKGGNTETPACATCPAGTKGDGTLLPNQPCVACSGAREYSLAGATSCSTCPDTWTLVGHTSCSECRVAGGPRPTRAGCCARSLQEAPARRAGFVTNCLGPKRHRRRPRGGVPIQEPRRTSRPPTLPAPPQPPRSTPFKLAGTQGAGAAAAPPASCRAPPRPPARSTQRPPAPRGVCAGAPASSPT